MWSDLKILIRKITKHNSTSKHALLSPKGLFLIPQKDAPMEKYQQQKITYEEIVVWFEKQNDSKIKQQMVLKMELEKKAP